MAGAGLEDFGFSLYESEDGYVVELELAVASGGFHDAAAEGGAVGDAEEQIPITWGKWPLTRV